MNGRNWSDDVRYAGIIVYSVGNRRNIPVKTRSGYVYVRNTGRMGCEGRDEEQIHGELCRELLGCGGADIMQAGGSLSGFTTFQVVRVMDHKKRLIYKSYYGENWRNFYAKKIL